jgi:hypothetical protein
VRALNFARAAWGLGGDKCGDTASGTREYIYRVIPSVLDPRKCEYFKDYSLFNLIFCKYILYL